MISFSDLDQTALAEREETMAAVLEDGYDLDASVGTVNRELIVRPGAALAVHVETYLSNFFDNMTLKSAAEQSSPDADLVEALASNFRLERLQGTLATGSVAIYTTTTNNVYIGSGTTFSVGDVVLALNKTYVGTYGRDGAGTSDLEYREMIKFDEDAYVFTVPVFTLDAVSSTLGTGQTLSISPSNGQVVKAEIASAVVGGFGEETITELVNRAACGVTAKVPSGKAHIEALVSRDLNLESFTVKAFGMGDVEVSRDRNNVAGTSMGGRCDLMCKTSPLLSETSVAKTAVSVGTNRWRVVLGASDFPGFYYVSRVVNEAGSVELFGDSGVSYSWGADVTWDDNPPDVPDGDSARFSSYQTAVCEFDFEGAQTDASGRASFTVYLAGLPNLDSIQDYLNSEDVANPAQDVLVKAPTPALTSVSLRVSHEPGLVTSTANDVKIAVADAINHLPVGRGYLTADDVVRAVRSVDEDFLVEFPVSFETVTVTRSGIFNARSVTGRLDAVVTDDGAATSASTAFFCGTGDVDVELVER